MKACVRWAVQSDDLPLAERVDERSLRKTVEGVIYRVLTGNAHPKPDSAKAWDVGNLKSFAGELALDASILDCGAFNSPAAQWLVQSGFTNVHAIDLNSNLINFAWARKTKASIQDIQATAYEEESFDLVYCASTIEHGVSWERFLTEAHRLLKRGGMLYISTDVVAETTANTNVTAFGLPWNPLSPPEVRSKCVAIGAAGFDEPPIELGSVTLERLPLKFGGIAHGFVAFITKKR